MILIRLEGGLGNQLFEYALGLRLSLDRQVPLKLDLTEFDRQLEGRTPRTYRLHHFNVTAQPATPADLAQFWDNAVWRKFYRRALRQFLPNHAPYALQEQTYFDYDERVVQHRGHLFLSGYWQNPRYFLPIEAHIRQEFTIQTAPAPQNADLLQTIQGVNAVSLHIRRGDYVTNPSANAVHGLLGLDYYHQAVQRLSEQITDTHIFVFSDDPQWAHDHLKLTHPMTFVSHNTPDTDYEDLRLMSACQHHIIANSSFSWWGAWLSPHPHKVIFAPSQWLRNNPVSGIIPQGWHVI